MFESDNNNISISGNNNNDCGKQDSCELLPTWGSILLGRQAAARSRWTKRVATLLAQIISFYCCCNLLLHEAVLLAQLQSFIIPTFLLCDTPPAMILQLVSLFSKQISSYYYMEFLPTLWLGSPKMRLRSPLASPLIKGTRNSGYISQCTLSLESHLELHSA